MIITEVMEDKVIETITYIKSVSKIRSSIDRIKTNLPLSKLLTFIILIGNENVWSTKICQIYCKASATKGS